MTLLTTTEIESTIHDIKQRYGITHCQRSAEEADGEVTFILFTIRFKVKKEKKVLDLSGKTCKVTGSVSAVEGKPAAR